MDFLPPQNKRMPHRGGLDVKPNRGAVMLLVGVISSSAWGAGGDVTLKTRDWSFSGPFGTFDKAAMQRGFQVYNEVCAGCHSMKLIAFRNFADLGYNEAEIKALAAQYEVQDGPNDDGEMFMRPAIPADRMPSPYANDNAARAGNNGALPPDLSLIAKARPNGPNYLYSLLSSYGMRQTIRRFLMECITMLHILGT